MNVFQTIKRNRRIVIIGAGVVYAIAAAALIAGVISGGIGILQAAALGIAATLPATMAVVSLDRRPSLLPVAWMAALVGAFLIITASPVWIVVALAWAFAGRSRPRPARDTRWMRWARPLLAIAVALPVYVMSTHLDPACTSTFADGHTEAVDPARRGFETGWLFGRTMSSSTQTTTGGPDVVEENCASDTVVWWEALASILASSAIVGAALRWPTSDQLADEPTQTQKEASRAG